MVNENNLPESELIRLGYEESSLNLDKLQECEGAPYCEECAENHIKCEATNVLYNSPLCYDCFTEFHG